MAKQTRTITTMTDDLTGGEFAEGEGETVSFAVEGAAYELDLSTASVEAFREHMGKYVQHARRVSSTGTRRARGKARREATAPRNTLEAATGSSSDSPSPAEVRAWAQQNGVEVNSRGRISATVVQQYLDAHG